MVVGVADVRRFLESLCQYLISVDVPYSELMILLVYCGLYSDLMHVSLPWSIMPCVLGLLFLKVVNYLCLVLCRLHVLFISFMWTLESWPKFVIIFL